MNIHESEKAAGILENLGYSETNDEKQADLILFNTCCIRDNAEKKAFGNIGAIKKLKKAKKSLIIVVMGCLAQEKGTVETIKEKYPYVDIVLGTNNLNMLDKAVTTVFNTKKKQYLIDPNEKPDIIEDERVLRTSYPNAWINITFGCNNFCTYCIVPYVRGRERSRKMEDILKEFENLLKEGYKEITFLGQNVNSYGHDLQDGSTFAKLLEAADKFDGKYRIRFMTSHPKDLSDELIETMHSSDKICKQFHLPMQSGSNKILKEMNRHYTREDYLELVRKLRESVPDIGLSTDIIVGFPGESEEDFEDTLELIKECRFDSVFTFIYSKRTGTPAAEMDNQVDDETVKNRFDRLLKVVNEISNEKVNEKLGEVVDVLIEEKNERLDNYVSGRLSNNTVVHVPADESVIGTIQQVKLNEAKGFYYMGEIVN